MIEILSQYPLVLLFTVASLGYLIGSIKIKGNSLGTAAILFTGLAIGAIDPKLQIPEIIFLLGLSIYVYSIGLSSGPAFFQSYKKNGIRDFIFAISMLSLAGLTATFLWWAFGFSAATITGVYTGSTTNTAALAGVLDFINNTFPTQEREELTQQAVIGYTYSYPMGVLGGMIAIILMERLFKIDYRKEEEQVKDTYPVKQKFIHLSILISNPTVEGITVRDLLKDKNWKFSFGRIYKKEKASLVGYDTVLELGDVVYVLGTKDELEKVISALGETTVHKLRYDSSLFDTRRIFISNPEIAGRTIASLNLDQKFDAIITRIRRGDVDMIADRDMVLETGDRIRFIARREDLDGLSKFFGDSYKASSKIDLFSFGLGIGLGLILGSFEVPMGTGSFKLGYAGGPLIVGLILGSLKRTGPIVWTLPYSANITLQQIGLILLLSAIGVRSGNAFIESFSFEAVWVFFASAVISLVTALSTLLIGYKLIKMPFGILMGMVSNQPAILDFATSRSNNKIPEYGYAMIFPIALISKIIIAQFLFLVLN